MSGTNHRKVFRRAFKANRISTTKSTHVCRETGARIAEMNGAELEEIARMGRWNRTKLVGCYLSSLPTRAMKQMAGYVNNLQAILHRDIPVPDELVSAVWPGVELVYEQVADENKDIAGRGKCKLLCWLLDARVHLIKDLTLIPYACNPFRLLATSCVFAQSSDSRYGLSLCSVPRLEHLRNLTFQHAGVSIIFPAYDTSPCRA